MPTDLKPSTAPPASALGGSELIPCTQSGASKALTPSQVVDYLATVVLTRLDVDNLRLDGNTISSTNANGDINLTPNGTGAATLGNGTAAAPTLRFTDDGSAKTGVRASTGHQLFLVSGGVDRILLDLNNGILALRSVGQVRFSSGSDPSTGYDLNVFRSGTSEATLGTTTGGISTLLCARTVEASTVGSASPNLLVSSESRKLLTNEGATAEAYNTLPSAAAGMEFAFAVQDADGLRVVAAAGDTIRLAGSVSAVAGFVRSTVIGSALILTAINATEWVALSVAGTWTVDI